MTARILEMTSSPTKEPLSARIVGAVIWSLLLVACVPSGILALILAVIVTPFVWLYSKMRKERP